MTTEQVVKYEQELKDKLSEIFGSEGYVYLTGIDNSNLNSDAIFVVQFSGSAKMTFRVGYKMFDLLDEDGKYKEYDHADAYKMYLTGLFNHYLKDHMIGVSEIGSVEELSEIKKSIELNIYNAFRDEE